MTTATTELWEQVDALDAGRGLVDRSRDRMLVVSGADARRWLGDLVTADIASLETGFARRTLLLSPTGRIRADLWTTQTDDDVFVLLQASDQAESIVDALRPYVLSSAVTLREATGTLAMAYVPGSGTIVTLDGNGAGEGAISVDEHAYEWWRIARGDPRMGVDFEAGSLPAGSGLERLIDMTKGCFLGQESVAKVRNLGHPPTVLLHLHAEGAVAPDIAVHTSDGAVGRITSAAPARRGGSVLLARVVRKAADAGLATANGVTLFPGGD